MRLRALSLVAALSLGGCMVGPDFKRPNAEVASGWNKNDPRFANEQTQADWWKSFNDPILDALIDRAYHQNLSLQIAGLRVVEARAQLGIAKGMLWPQVQELYASGAVTNLTEQQATALKLDRPFIGYQVGFDAVWELDFWGKFRRGIQADSAALLGSIGDYYFALVSLTAEVARTYAMIRTYEELIDQANDNVKLQEDAVRIAESRLRNGATSELDVTQSTTLLESTRATVPKLQAGLEQARNAMATLLGQSSGSVDAMLGKPGKIPATPTKVAVSVPAEMLRRRPDVRAAELYAAAQCSRIGVAKADLYPSFSIFGSIGFAGVASGGTATNPFSAAGLVYSFGPQINWPFFQYGRITNNVRVQDARFEELLVGYRNTVLKAAQEVEDAMSGYVNGLDSAVAQERAVKSAKRSVEISVLSYQEGAVDYQRVLDAERSLLQEENTLTETRSAIVTSLIALYKALGGGWEFSLGKPFVPASMQREMKDRTSWGDMLSDPESVETKKRR
jgi:NodT family efflux transporter outer membrane factor (OMF) lipoprotein